MRKKIIVEFVKRLPPDIGVTLKGTQSFNKTLLGVEYSSIKPGDFVVGVTPRIQRVKEYNQMLNFNPISTTSFPLMNCRKL